MKAAFTNGRKFERYDSYGGHGGPYHSLYSVIRDSIRLMGGCATLTRCVIRDRAKLQGQPGYTVAVLEKSGLSISVYVYGANTTNPNFAVPDRTCESINLPRRIRVD